MESMCLQSDGDSVLLYGSETWAVTQQDLRRLHAFQMKCLWDIVGVTLWDRRRNEDILAETGEVPVKALLKLDDYSSLVTSKGCQTIGHSDRC